MLAVDHAQEGRYIIQQDYWNYASPRVSSVLQILFYTTDLFTKYLVGALNCFCKVIQSNLIKTTLHFFLNDMTVASAGRKQHFKLTNTSYPEIYGRAMGSLWWVLWWKLQFNKETKLYIS